MDTYLNILFVIGASAMALTLLFTMACMCVVMWRIMLD